MNRETRKSRSASFRALLALTFSVAWGCAHRAPTRHEPPPAQLDARDLYTRGVALAQRGDLLRAEQYLSLARRAGYPEARVIPWLLDLCLSGSRYRAALGYAEPYLDEHPEDQRLRTLVEAIRAALLGGGRPVHAPTSLANPRRHPTRQGARS